MTCGDVVGWEEPESETEDSEKLAAVVLPKIVLLGCASLSVCC